MKKVFLAFTVVGLITLTSCKSESQKVEDATENATEQTTEAAANVVETVNNTENVVLEVPQFSNTDVQKFAQEYAAYTTEVLTAMKNRDGAKVAELQQKSVEWAQKANEYTQKMTEEDAVKWANWTKKIAETVQNQGQ